MAKDIKKAKTEYDIHDLIKNRWSPRAFADKAVEKDQLLKLFDAARWAASSFNEQPWRFIVGIKGEESYLKVRETLVEFNRDWSATAPVLLLAIGKKTFSKNGKPNKHSFYDTGQAMANFALQATADGLHIHQMAGFSAHKAIELFNIPDDFEPIAACALGYKGDPDQLDEKNKKSELSERSRKPLEEIVFEEEWGVRFGN